MPERSRHLAPMLSVAGVGLVLLCLISLLIGAGDVGAWRSLETLFGQGDEQSRFVIYGLRWPRTELAVVVGIALGAAGVLLQSVTRNTLAEPGLLGVSAGSSFAVVMAISLGASASSLAFSVAVLGALIGCLLVMAVCRLRGVGSDPVRLILAGAAFSGFLSALSGLLLLRDQRTADEMRFWVIGSLAGRPVETLYAALPSLICGLILMLPLVRPLAALALGEALASSLGHHPQRVRLGVLIVVAMLVGTANAAAGPIGFLGLIVPFMARRMVGSDIRQTIRLSLLLGPSVLLGADIVSRLLVSPYELPIGVVTAFIGAPVLIATVRAQRLPIL